MWYIQSYLVDYHTSNNLPSENGDLKRSRVIKRIVKGDGESVVPKSEFRHGVPMTDDVFRR